MCVFFKNMIMNRPKDLSTYEKIHIEFVLKMYSAEFRIAGIEHPAELYVKYYSLYSLSVFQVGKLQKIPKSLEIYSTCVHPLENVRGSVVKLHFSAVVGYRVAIVL